MQGLDAKIIFQAFCGGTVTVVDPGEVPVEQRFYLIPGNDGPRWLVPVDPVYGYLVLRYWRPYGWRSYVAWRILLTVYRFGLLGRMPRVSLIGVQAESGAGYPSMEEVVPIIYIGTPGPSQKLVATLLDRKSRIPISLFKAPLTPGAGKKIIREARILEQLNRICPGMGPDLIAMDQTNGVSYQTVLVGGQGARKWQQAYLEVLLGLKAEGMIDLHVWREWMAKAIDAASELSPMNYATLSFILENFTKVECLPAMLVHGDFMPWNIIHRQTGRICLVDWEDALGAGLPLFDLVYFYSMQAELFGYQDIFPNGFGTLAKMYLNHLDIPDRHLAVLVLACLFCDWQRCIAEGKTQRAGFLMSQMERYRKEWFK